MPFFQSIVTLSPLALFSHLFFGAGLVLVSMFITRIMLYRFRILDTPNDRSSHTMPIPKSGGLAVVATFLLGIMAIYLLGDKTLIYQGYFAGFVLSSLAIAVVSFYDDINYKSFTVKLGTQVLAACVVIAFGVVIDEIGLPRVGLVELGLRSEERRVGKEC